MIKALVGITALLVGLTGPQAPAQAHEPSTQVTVYVNHQGNMIADKIWNCYINDLVVSCYK